MPGMGGMGGMPGMGGGMPGGFGAGMDGGMGSSKPPPPEEVVKTLGLTLEELYKGGTKRMRLQRRLRNGTQEPKELEVVYKPGWKSVRQVLYRPFGNIADSHSSCLKWS